MGGQKNWRILRIVVGSLCILAVVYLLYSHRQTHNELQMKNRYLDVAEEEYKTLTKRFDMLGNELKSESEPISLLCTVNSSSSFNFACFK